MELKFLQEPILATQTTEGADYGVKRTAEEHGLIGTEVVVTTFPLLEGASRS